MCFSAWRRSGPRSPPLRGRHFTGLLRCSVGASDGIPSRHPGRPGCCDSPECDRQRSEAPPCAATPRSSGDAVRRIDHVAAVRAGETRCDRWEEIDLDSGMWTIPAARLNSAREFTVPLSTGALDGLGRAHCPLSRALCFRPRQADRCRTERPPACLGVSGWTRRYMASARPHDHGWPNQESRRKSQKPVFPTFCDSKSFRRISDPTFWSAEPKSARRGATTSHSECPPTGGARSPLLGTLGSQQPFDSLD